MKLSEQLSNKDLFIPVKNVLIMVFSVLLIAFLSVNIFKYYSSPSIEKFEVAPLRNQYGLKEEYVANTFGNNVIFISGYKSIIKSIFNGKGRKSQERNVHISINSNIDFGMKYQGVELSFNKIMNFIYPHDRILKSYLITDSSKIALTATFGSDEIFVEEVVLSKNKENVFQIVDKLYYKMALWYLEVIEPNLMVDYYSAIKNDSAQLKLCYRIILDYNINVRNNRSDIRILKKNFSKEEAKEIMITACLRVSAIKPREVKNMPGFISHDLQAENTKEWLDRAHGYNKNDFDVNYEMYVANYSNRKDREKYIKICKSINESNSKNIFFITDKCIDSIFNLPRQGNLYTIDSAYLKYTDESFAGFLETARKSKSLHFSELYYEIASFYSTVLEYRMYGYITLSQNVLDLCYSQAVKNAKSAISYALDSTAFKNYTNISEYYNRLAYINEQYVLCSYDNTLKSGNADGYDFNDFKKYNDKHYYYALKSIEYNPDNFWAYSTLAEWYAINDKFNPSTDYGSRFEINAGYAIRLGYNDFFINDYVKVMPYSFIPQNTLNNLANIKLREHEKIMAHLKGIAFLKN